jgi:hypothetical protein
MGHREKAVPEVNAVSKINTLNDISILTRREIEARIAIPLLEALGEKYDRTEVLEVARQVITELAAQQGAQLAEDAGDSSLEYFARALEAWKEDDALEMEILENNEVAFSFNVRRCRYAEMYRDLGFPELGELLSCSRDAALIEGFNPAMELQRTQTLMEGGSFCDFRYRLRIS